MWEWMATLGWLALGMALGAGGMQWLTMPARQTAFEAGYRLGLVDGRQEMRDRIRQWMRSRVDLRGPAA